MAASEKTDRLLWVERGPSTFGSSRQRLAIRLHG
jgi:hypothetical protein